MRIGKDFVLFFTISPFEVKIEGLLAPYRLHQEIKKSVGSISALSFGYAGFSVLLFPTTSDPVGRRGVLRSHAPQKSSSSGPIPSGLRTAQNGMVSSTIKAELRTAMLPFLTQIRTINIVSPSRLTTFGNSSI